MLQEKKHVRCIFEALSNLKQTPSIALTVALSHINVPTEGVAVIGPE